MTTPNNDQTPCPHCQGTGYLRAVKVEGALKVMVYVCDRCEREWRGLERSADSRTGDVSEPRMIK